MWFLCRLINFLRTLKIESDVSGGIDNVTLALQMALLFALDVNDIIKREDSEGNDLDLAWYFSKVVDPLIRGSVSLSLFFDP